MEQFVRENDTIYIGGNKIDLDGAAGVNINHLEYGMIQGEHKYIVATYFGIQFIIFKGSKLFDLIYPKFISIKEKLNNLRNSDVGRYCYEPAYNTAKSDLELIVIDIAMEYVNPEDIRNYIAKEKEKSYNEGYDEHRKRLREVFGLSK